MVSLRETRRGRCQEVFRLSMLPLMGVELALIDRVRHLFTYPIFFTYPNELLAAAGHRGSDKRGYTVFLSSVRY